MRASLPPRASAFLACRQIAAASEIWWAVCSPKTCGCRRTILAVMPLDDVRPGERFRLPRYLCVEHDIGQQIAKLAGDFSRLAVVDRVNDLRGLLEHILAQRRVRLRAVPWASIGPRRVSNTSRRRDADRSREASVGSARSVRGKTAGCPLTSSHVLEVHFRARSRTASPNSCVSVRRQCSSSAASRTPRTMAINAGSGRQDLVAGPTIAGPDRFG